MASKPPYILLSLVNLIFEGRGSLFKREDPYFFHHFFKGNPWIECCNYFYLSGIIQSWSNILLGSMQDYNSK